MEQSVVGLSKAAVEGTVIAVKAAIEEEEKVKAGVQEDLEFITGEFQMMQSFLNVADGERAKNKVVTTWVGQVRDLAYDVEDCIELIVHLDDRPSWGWRLLPSLLVPAWALPWDAAAANVRQLKGRVEAVAQRNMRYRLIGDTGAKPKSAASPPAAEEAEAAAFDALVEAREAARKQSDLKWGDLAGLISREDDGLQVISLWGTGGNLGMASIIRNAYDDAEIRKSFEHRAWVKLVDPLNPHDLIRSLEAQFYARQAKQGDSNHEGAMVAAATDFEELVKRVKEKKFLVVLEGVSAVVEWDAIYMYLQGSVKGSRIVVSTQQYEIGSFCTGQPHRVVELRQFSAHHSICAIFHELQASQLETPPKKDEAELFGRDDELAEISNRIDWADKEERHIVLCVLGVAGVGKTAIVKRAYNGNRKGGYFDMYGWVDVSHPFNLRDLSRSLLSDLMDSEPPKPRGTLDKIGMMGIKDPIQECCKLLCQQSRLVVIDGLRSTEEWDSIKSALLPGDCQSVIIVVTAEESVAQYSARPYEKLFHIRCLQADAAKDLFQKVLDTSFLTSDLSKLAEDILKKCGGLPKVIRAIGGYMQAIRPEDRKRVWNELNDTFMQQLETNPVLDTLRGLIFWMHSYFRSCEDYLKPCIFYLSIFPELTETEKSYSIRRMRLVRRWIAEGYSRETDTNVAGNWDAFFRNLEDLSIISSRKKDVQVNSFFHWYINSWPMEDKCIFALEGRCSLSSQRSGRHLVIGETWDRDKVVFESIDFSRLRSLTVFGKWMPFFITDKMELLRVLDLEDAAGVADRDVEKIGRLLPRLKFLSLRGCRGVSRLPSSLGRLRQLQTLDVRHTSVAKLPSTILKLKKLQFIHAGATSPTLHSAASSWMSLLSCLSEFWSRQHCGGVALPRGIGKLTALHTLGDVDVSVAGQKGVLKELKSLTQLRKLKVSGINRSDIQDLIFDHGHLESLSVSLHANGQASFNAEDRHWLPPKSLQKLKLYGLAYQLPAWIMKLRNLCKLYLQMTSLTQEDAFYIQELPHLHVLHLSAELFQYGTLDFTSNCVRDLEIKCNSDLLVKFGWRPMLEELEIRCPGQTLQFSGLCNLESLKKAFLECCCSAELKKSWKVELRKRLNQKEPVLEIKE